MDVASQAGTFGKIPLEELLKNVDTKRNSKGGYAQTDWNFTTDSYATEEHGAESKIDDREAKMYADYFQLEQISTMRAFSIVLRNAEKRVADAVFGATWSSGGAGLTTTVTNEWDDFVNAVPITDIEAAVSKVYDGSGLWANALVINRRVFRNLRNCEQIIERINSSGAGNPSKASDVTEQMLAAVFDLQHIIVAGASRNSAAEGQTATPAQIWSSEYAMVCKVADSNDMHEPCIGRTFHWSEDGSQIGGTVEKYRDETVRADKVRVRHETTEKLLYAQAGHLLSNVTTL